MARHQGVKEVTQGGQGQIPGGVRSGQLLDKTPGQPRRDLAQLDPCQRQVEMSCFGRLAGAPWRGPRRLGMTLRVSAADPFGQLTGASVFVGGIALVKSRS